MIVTQLRQPAGMTRKRSKQGAGFSLIELMISIGVFVVVTGAAVSLFNGHAQLFNDQQGVVGLNITLRNALSQIQTDAVQAGNGFFGNLSTSNTPVGITINNSAGSFDSFYIIQSGIPGGGVPLDPATPCNLLTTSGAATLAATAGVSIAQFPAGTVVLFMNGNGNQMTVATLKGSTAGAAGKINITYNATNIDGTNGIANDPFGLTWTAHAATDPDQLTDQFCPGNGDYVVPLTWVQYSVNGANQLIRQTAGSADIVADQIISFKVGAATVGNGGVGTTTTYYSFNSAAASPTGYNSKFTMIRSIRVSLIGRTNPNQYSGSNFRNAFDGGNYKIEALSLVINPRNLSMND